MQHIKSKKNVIRKKLLYLQKSAVQNGIDLCLIKQFNYVCNFKENSLSKKPSRKLIILLGTVFTTVALASFTLDYIRSSRCLLPINHLVWEATRPLADCAYCTNVTRPIILRNVTRQLFKDYAYSSKPIIVKNTIRHWRAIKELNFYMFKKLYEETLNSYESLEEGCQFLNFKTDLFTLKDVFEMPDTRVRNEYGQAPWYVGWGNCHPDILAEVRKFYSIPEFLPEDAEFPKTENIFFGYEIGAVMHLDYIPRLMWQGQVRGNKTWSITPVPECEQVCDKFQFYVEPGDIVLLDTRLWYHATSIEKGELSLTVQSEYG